MAYCLLVGDALGELEDAIGIVVDYSRIVIVVGEGVVHLTGDRLLDESIGREVARDGRAHHGSDAAGNGKGAADDATNLPLLLDAGEDLADTLEHHGTSEDGSGDRGRSDARRLSVHFQLLIATSLYEFALSSHFENLLF